MRAVVYDDWQKLDECKLRHMPSGCVLQWFTTQEPEHYDARFISIPPEITDAGRDELEQLRQMAIGYARVFGAEGGFSRRRRQ